MKINLRIACLAFTLTAVVFPACSHIKIINPRADQRLMGTPHDLVVAHTGCGMAIGDSFRAQLNYSLNTTGGQFNYSLDITSAFRYDSSKEKWTATRYNLLPGRNTLSVSAEVSVSGWCFRDSGTDSHTFTVVANCPPESYCAYFYDNPKVADATINIFDQTTLSYFWEYIDQLEETEKITIAEPEELRACVEPASCTVITLTDTEIKRIHAAKSAHAVWLDKNRKLNWQLHDYTEEELRDLFAKELLFDPGGNTFFSVVDYSPSDVYRYALENGLIGSNKMNTVYLVLNDLRGNNIQTSFYHGSHDLDGDKLNTAHSLYNALTVCSPRPSNVCVRIARHGCHSMSRIIIGLLRSLNIPGQIVWNGTWFETSHSSAVWPALQHVMPHGDDIYEGSMRAVPNEEFLIPFSFYENAQNTAVCGTNKPCLSHRHHALMAMRYPAEWVEERCCNPAGFGYTSCAAYLGEDYGAYLTADELAAAVSSISGLCP